MKRMMIILFAIGMTVSSCTTTTVAAMSTNDIRVETRFLTDKMAYELNMSTMQYNDVYEINYDFAYSVGYLMDDVLRGEAWAMDRYYQMLDIRNDDLRWVLSAGQYRRFIGVEYFYRPIYVTGNRWQFRVYAHYSNHHHFYYDKPHHYTSYRGGHYRTQHNNVSYYRGRYRHDVYGGAYSVRRDNVYTTNRRSDFGSVKVRPNSARQSSNTNTSRRSESTTSRSSSQRNSNNVSTSPSRNSSSNSSGRTSSSRSNSSSSSDNNKNTTTRPSSNSSSSSNSNRSSSRSNSSVNSSRSSSGGSSSRSTGGGSSRSSSSSSSSRSSSGSRR
ncbi:hypothetical protein [Bacteroides sp. 224]|uniref:hypothetical protein n=1 Tax=Bacteroides sp. 224 TaxID=2302936 RepID=UPI0013D05510|nr:hypothetical protein [Bacteroides sp. 224]NDV64100.1 hypothetical protein [Bacteroides sp. 224]